MERLVPLLALTTLFAACSDDSKKVNDVVDTAVSDTTVASEETTADTQAFDVLDPATVRVYTSAEVCELVSLATASATLGVEVTEVSVSDMSTPQCSYDFVTADGTFTNLTLAVQRPIEDLGGAAGEAGFDVTTMYAIFDAPYEPIDGLGDKAAVAASASFTMVAVLANDQVFTIATSAPIDVANLVAFGNAVVENL